MAYDPSTNTITLGQSSNYLVDTGVWSVHTYKKIVANNEANDEIKKDWQVLEMWLGCTGRELTSADDLKIGNAWQAWMGMGVAPSQELQPAFDMMKAKVDVAFVETNRPPRQVMNVFNRMLATEEVIATKFEQNARKVKQGAANLIADLESDHSLIKRVFTEKFKQARFVALCLTTLWLLWVYSDFGSIARVLDEGKVLIILAVAVLIFYAIAYAYSFAQPRIDKFKRTADKETRIAASINLLWVIAVASWGFIFRWSSEFSEDEYVALFVLPSIFIWVALRLLKWTREK